LDRTVVAGLLPGSPGERSGLAAGDEIVAVDGVRVTERAEIYERIWSHPPGEVVELGVNRDGELLKLPVLGVDVDEFFST
jgi:S1-C subfamily serine protease